MYLTQQRTPTTQHQEPAPILCLAHVAECYPIEHALASLTESVLLFCNLSTDLLHNGQLAIPDAQFKLHADQAVAAMQTLRSFDLGMSAPATQLSQALSVLVLATSLVHNKPGSELDSELTTLLAHTIRRAKNHLCRLHTR